MPYTPSAASATFLTTLASYLNDLGYAGLQSAAVPTTPTRAIADALASYFGLIGGAGAPKLWVVTAQAVNFNALVGHHYRVNATAGNVTATLPAAAAGNAGQDISFKKTDNVNQMILASASLIDGAAVVPFAAQWTAITVRSTGATWDVV